MPMHIDTSDKSDEAAKSDQQNQQDILKDTGGNIISNLKTVSIQEYATLCDNLIEDIQKFQEYFPEQKFSPCREGVFTAALGLAKKFIDQTHGPFFYTFHTDLASDFKSKGYPLILLDLEKSPLKSIQKILWIFEENESIIKENLQEIALQEPEISIVGSQSLAALELVYTSAVDLLKYTKQLKEGLVDLHSPGQEEPQKKE